MVNGLDVQTASSSAHSNGDGDGHKGDQWHLDAKAPSNGTAFEKCYTQSGDDDEDELMDEDDDDEDDDIDLDAWRWSTFGKSLETIVNNAQSLYIEPLVLV